MKLHRVWNVLVFPGGTENGLEIYKSLKYAKEVKLFSVSNSVLNHAEFVYGNHFEIPGVNEYGCLKELNKVIEENKIDFVFPANSLVIDFLIKNRSKVLTKVLQPESKVVKLIRSKKKTYSFFENILNVPIVFENTEQISKYPVFIKPDAMYGAQGARKVTSKEELIALKEYLKDFVISEFLPGEEFTVECLSSRKQGLMYCLARTRQRIRMGTSMHCEQADEPVQEKVQWIANKIFENLGIDGLWFFQVKFDENGFLKLLEIESRVAGTMAYSRCKGVNLPLASLYVAQDLFVDIRVQSYRLVLDRSLVNRYKIDVDYEVVYVDLDNTIVVDDNLNIDMIKFLYQCVNKNIKIVLISKSIQDDKEGCLVNWKIDRIFDEKIWLEEEDSKADYIKYKKSIFIDDSFSQRAEVERRHRIPTFEPNMIEVLLDERYS